MMLVRKKSRCLKQNNHRLLLVFRQGYIPLIFLDKWFVFSENIAIEAFVDIEDTN